MSCNPYLIQISDELTSLYDFVKDVYKDLDTPPENIKDLMITLEDVKLKIRQKLEESGEPLDT